MLALTRTACRELDRRIIEQFGMPGLLLMENAGSAMARLLLSLGVTGPVGIVCGKGNNGGDGFVIARYLDLAGLSVRIFEFADEATGDAAVMREILMRAGLVIEKWPALDRLLGRLQGLPWIVDALFGTGLSTPPREPYPEVIAAINASGAKVFAVDLPSGLDADTGEPLGGCVRADHTATVLAPKVGFSRAASWTGQVHVVEIGAPRAALLPPCDTQVPQS
ncbi:MAG: NAD(P)H-hydrate epimerase [Gemmataceae bacterium]